MNRSSAIRSHSAQCESAKNMLCLESKTFNVVKLSRISLVILVAPWIVLLAAAPGCQSDAHTSVPPGASGQSAARAAADDSPQIDGAPDEANPSTPTDEVTEDARSNDESGLTTTIGGATSVQKGAELAAQLLSPQQHYAAGIEQEQAGNSSAAIAHYTAALELDPKFADARKRLGALLLASKRYIDASILYGQLVENEPENPDAHNDWGVVLVRIGNLQEAIGQFREALRLKSDHPDAHYNLATALLTTGKVVEAKEHLVEALRIQPSYTDAYFALGRAYFHEDKLDAAIAQFEHVKQLDRNYGGLNYQLGRAFMRKQNLRRAVQHFSEAVREAPLHFEAHFALGLALSQYGNHQGAAAQFTEAVQLEPENPDAHFQLAQALVQVDRIEEAIWHNDTAITLRPEWPEALNNQAWLLATVADTKLRDPERALELAMRAKQLADYKMPLVLDTLAAAQAAVGDFEQARQNAAKALEWANTSNQTDVAREIERRLENYRAERPHQPAALAEPIGGAQ